MNTFMLGAIVGFVVAAVIAVVIAVVYLKKNAVIEITDDLPKSSKATAKAMKLSNELAPYIQERDGKLVLKVRK